MQSNDQQNPEKSSPPEEKRGDRREGGGSEPPRGPRQPRPYPDLVDETLDDSFPASDPPSWAGQ